MQDQQIQNYIFYIYILAETFGIGIHGHQRMNLTNFGDHLTFYIALHKQVKPLSYPVKYVSILPDELVQIVLQTFMVPR